MEIIRYVLLFLFGFFSCALIFYASYDLENPSGATITNAEAPQDWIKSNQIRVLKDKIIIDVEDASLSRYAPTGSMKPLLDEGANGIRIKPTAEDDIQIGDIISFRSNGHLIVHRVVEKGIDQEGVYFIAKGDNNFISDGKIRFEDITHITVGILY